jgi:hypothetical protein
MIGQVDVIPDQHVPLYTALTAIFLLFDVLTWGTFGFWRANITIRTSTNRLMPNDPTGCKGSTNILYATRIDANPIFTCIVIRTFTVV